MSRTFYIDSQNGTTQNNGLSPESPLASWRGLELSAGDTVLLRRGMAFADLIDSPSGEEGAPVTWGAYGEGAAPVLKSTVPLNDPAGWRYMGGRIWQWDRPLPGEPANVILNADTCGTLRWSEHDLSEEADWFDPGLGKTEQHHLVRDPADRLLFCCAQNPARAYDSLEAVLYGGRALAKAQTHAVFRDLAFYGSGVHGFAAADAEDILLQNCSFSFIGGAVWNKDRRIRFGNGVEFWNSARRVRVKNCSFREIYDSCFTHQGQKPYPVPQDIVFTGCTCQNYGMAAYEVRDVIPVRAVFSHNICTGAGCGFAMQGETLPRRSEIWPQPKQWPDKEVFMPE